MKLPDIGFGRLAVVFVALLAIGMVFAAPVVATSHVDTLAGDGTDVIEEFEAADDQYIEYDLASDDADFATDGTETVYMNISHADIDHFETSADVDGVDAAYTFNLSHEDLETLPGGASETTTVNVSAWGEDDEGTITTTMDEFEADVQFNNTHATIYVTEADGVEDEERFIRSDIFETEWNEEVAIDGDNTDVNVFTDDEDISEAVDLATEGTEDGDRVALLMATTVDGELTYVFDGEAGETIAGEDIEDTDYSYIVVENDDEAVIYVGEDHADEEEIEVNAIANVRPDAGDLRTDLDYGWLASLAGALGIGIPLLTIGAVGAMSVRRRRQSA